LKAVEKLFYLDVDLYRYFIGRDDQSVNMDVMMKRQDQQFKVNRLLLEEIAHTEVKSKRLDRYLAHYAATLTAVTSVMVAHLNTKEAKTKRLEMLRWLRKTDSHLWVHVRWSAIGFLSGGRTILGRKAAIRGYEVANKVLGLN
jgi:hypothetical protein